MTNLSSFPSASSSTDSPSDQAGRVATLKTGDLVEYASLAPGAKRLLAAGLALTRRNLSYQYGSDDPANGGMDCSGTIYYLLHQAGIQDVPRDSSEQYEWIWKKDRFRAVVSSNPNTFELQKLRPGDLLFWTGTYRIDRDPPVTHVMIYLGTNRLTGQRAMVGASDGRTFNGKPRYGVSVFDFKLPGVGSGGAGRHGTTENDGESRFIGYGSIPGLEEASGNPAGLHGDPIPKD